MNLSYSNLKQCSEELKRSYQNIANILSEIKEVKSQITKTGCWTGSASDKYVQKLGNFTDSFDDIITELNSSLSYLNSVLERYEDIERQVSSSLIR